MNFIWELFHSTTFLFSVIGFLLLALGITYVRLMVIVVEVRSAQLLANERTMQAHTANRQLQQTLGSIYAQVWYLDTEARVVDFNQLPKIF
ncbi:MAG: hypothetical protein R2867_26000 [Caldilineaceae bacterium]